MEEVKEFCPAKVNLFLAVTGRREDGFHELISVMVPIDLGDSLRVSRTDRAEISFQCSDPSLPQDESNLVLRAVEAFRKKCPFDGGLEIELEKRVPAGAGLGGGSSDAAGMLLALNRLIGEPLGMDALREVAASIGSDCPFFLTGQAAVVRGRGERITLLPPEVQARFRGQRLFLMKPSFPVPTAWAYRALAQMPQEYIPAARAEALWADWLGSSRSTRELLFNNLEPPVFRKFAALPVLKRQLEEGLGLAVLMSGSGSTLLALLDAGTPTDQVEAIAREGLGEAGWLQKVRIL